jgi:hypothetical protein
MHCDVVVILLNPQAMSDRVIAQRHALSMKSISEQHVRTRTTVCVCVCVVHHTRMCRLWSRLTLHTDRPRCRRDRAPCRTCRRATPTDRCRFRAGARRRAEYARSVRVRARVLTMCCVALCAALMMCNAWHRVTHSRRSQCRTARVWRASSLLQARLVVLVQTSSLITHLCCRSLRADTHTHTRATGATVAQGPAINSVFADEMRTLPSQFYCGQAASGGAPPPYCCSVVVRANGCVVCAVCAVLWRVRTCAYVCDAQWPARALDVRLYGDGAALVRCDPVADERARQLVRVCVVDDVKRW